MRREPERVDAVDVPGVDHSLDHAGAGQAVRAEQDAAGRESHGKAKRPTRIQACAMWSLPARRAEISHDGPERKESVGEPENPRGVGRELEQLDAGAVARGKCR